MTSSTHRLWVMPAPKAPPLPSPPARPRWLSPPVPAALCTPYTAPAPPLGCSQEDAPETCPRRGLCCHCPFIPPHPVSTVSPELWEVEWLSSPFK